jgi:anti-sigma factor RsiW
MSTGSNDHPPTDLELMLYFDGELEPDRVAAVEAHLARDRAAASKLGALQITSGVVRAEALAASSPSASIADAVMASVAAESKAKPGVVVPFPASPAAARAANRNARGIFGLAAAAVAAAAALLIWGRTEAPPTFQPENARPIVAIATDVAPEPPAPSSPSRQPEGEREHGVEVAAVDFGARVGTIFYVPTEGASTETTTVVWLSDSAGGD